MPASRFREEVLNVVLAQLLNERGVVSSPEQIVNWRQVGRRLPDVLVLFQGLRTVIEGKVAGTGVARQQVLLDATKRVEEGIAHVAIAVLYAPELRRATSLPSLSEQMKHSPFEINICTESGVSGWAEADLNGLADMLRRTFEALVREDVVARAVAAIEAGVGRFSEAMRPYL